MIVRFEHRIKLWDSVVFNITISRLTFVIREEPLYTQ